MSPDNEPRADQEHQTDKRHPLAQRSVRSISWTTLSTLVALPVTFIQSVFLARLLPVEYFGIFAGMTSLILISSTIFEFGFANAFLHRSAETEDEATASAAYFTLNLIFQTIWALSLVGAGWFLFTDLRRLVLLFLVLTSYLLRLTTVPRVLLVRRVAHRRMAMLDLGANMTSAVLSVLIAWSTRSIWALLVSSVVSIVFSVGGLYFWKPFWKPRLLWDRAVMRYFLWFGSKNLLNNVLDSALDNLDNLWTNFFLGDLLLGFYSRAFKFATYPRLVLSTPVNSVVIGTYSALKYDRHRLSRAFFQTNALLIRTGFLFAGWLALIAPEFIRLLIGEKWLPMLAAFRLMLVFALLDPIKVSIANVLLAVGKPEKILAVRLTQIVILVIALFFLGFRFQISGVAVAMNLMIVAGTLLSLYYVRAYVDVSLRRLFAVPVLALAAGIGLSALTVPMIVSSGSDWLVAGAKTILFIAGYSTLLFGLEGRDILRSLDEALDFRSLANKTRILFHHLIPRK